MSLPDRLPPDCPPPRAALESLGTTRRPVDWRSAVEIAALVILTWTCVIAVGWLGYISYLHALRH